MVMVLTASGEGAEYADSYSIKIFETYEEADKYMKSVNDPYSEKWTVAEPISESQSFYAFGGLIYYNTLT